MPQFKPIEAPSNEPFFTHAVCSLTFSFIYCKLSCSKSADDGECQERIRQLEKKRDKHKCKNKM